MAWRHRTVAQEHEVLALSKTYTIKQIAKLTGLSAWTVFDVRRKYHWVQLFGRHHAARNRYAYDEHAWGRVIEELYHEQRLTQQQVADRLGIDVGTVRRRMDDIGLRRRTTAESNTGTHRGRYNWRPDLPRCACGRGIAKAGEEWCAACRRSRARRDRASGVA